MAEGAAAPPRRPPRRLPLRRRRDESARRRSVVERWRSVVERRRGRSSLRAAGERKRPPPRLRTRRLRAAFRAAPLPPPTAVSVGAAGRDVGKAAQGLRLRPADKNPEATDENPQATDKNPRGAEKRPSPTDATVAGHCPPPAVCRFAAAGRSARPGLAGRRLRAGALVPRGGRRPVAVCRYEPSPAVSHRGRKGGVASGAGHERQPEGFRPRVRKNGCMHRRETRDVHTAVRCRRLIGRRAGRAGAPRRGRPRRR